MKGIVEGFYARWGFYGRFSLTGLLAVASLMTSSLSAAEKEVWYGAEGKPVLVKDKTTGKLRLPNAEELKNDLSKPVIVAANVESKEGLPEVEGGSDPEAKFRKSLVTTEPAPKFTANSTLSSNAVIPKSLVPRVYGSQRFYAPRAHCFVPYYPSAYPYTFKRVAPHFSRSRWCGAGGYYHPYYHHHSYYGHYHSRYGKKFQLRYSRPGLSIRARF